MTRINRNRPAAELNGHQGVTVEWLVVVVGIMGFSMRTRFTCVDAVQEASHHDHLEGRGSAAEDHQHGARHGHQIVQQEAPFPAGMGEECVCVWGAWGEGGRVGVGPVVKAEGDNSANA